MQNSPPVYLQLRANIYPNQAVCNESNSESVLHQLLNNFDTKVSVADPAAGWSEGDKL